MKTLLWLLVSGTMALMSGNPAPINSTNLIFQKEIYQANLLISQIKNIAQEKTLLFVGDIMLDRGVEYQIRQHGGDYKFPFEKITDYLKQADLVIGNLEGPVVNDPATFPSGSLTFNFDNNVAYGLKYAGFDILSLANNHTINAGRSGLNETKNILSELGINYFGDPVGCDNSDVIERENIVFIGINKTFPSNCSNKEIFNLIKKEKESHKNNPVVVFIHWGDEYKTSSSETQQILAHGMIDSGADLIIGSHPHVIQEIEQYKDKYIVYSLGNFVFDQNFSEETMEGLMIKARLINGKFNIEPIKIKINKTFQPELVN